MRELLIKNVVSKDRKRSEILLAEYVAKNGITQTIEKKIKYTVKAILEFTDAYDLELFVKQKAQEAPCTQTFIITNRNAHTGTAKFIYKTVGDQYTVIGDKVVILRIAQHVQKTVFDSAKECADKQAT